MWSWSDLAVVGHWSGEEGRLWSVSTQLLQLLFQVAFVTAASCQDTDWVKENKENVVLFLISLRMLI